MSIFRSYDKSPGEGVAKKGPELFFEVLGREFWSLIKLNLLFLLFCIPMVTIPAAMTAVAKIIFLMLRDKHHELFSDFFICFKKRFFTSLLVGLVFFIIIGSSLYSFHFYGLEIANPVFSLILRTVLVILIAVGVMAAFFAFPMIALTDLSARHILKNAFFLVVIMFPRNLITLGLFILLWFTALAIYPYSLPLAILILFSLSGIVTTIRALDGINKYILK